MRTLSRNLLLAGTLLFMVATLGCLRLQPLLGQSKPQQCSRLPYRNH